MGKKARNDHEASGSGVKKEKGEHPPPGRVPLNAELARAMHERWLPCNWSNVHLPGGGWRLSWRRVPIPPLPAAEPARTAEIKRRRRYLPADLREDPAYAVGSARWDCFRRVEKDKRRIAGFLGDRDFPFGVPARSRREPPPPPARRAMEAPPASLENWPGRVVRDDSEDYVAAVFYGLRQAEEHGEEYDLPEDLTDEEMARLGILMSEVPQPAPPLPHYAIGVMPADLNADEAYERAVQESLHQAQLEAQMASWAPPATPPPPPPPAAPAAYAPPASDWPWEIPPYIVIDDDEEQK